ncbi:hypothetical protein WME91_56545 [Sorangium sp. So ce269]
MISIHGKVMGLAMVMAALGTGCAVDAADAELDQAGLDEVEELDSTAAALEEGAVEERGGYQAQAPTKDLFGPSKGAPSKGMLGQAPVGQLGQAPTGQEGLAPVGAPGLAGGTPVQGTFVGEGAGARFFGGCCGGFPGAFGGFPGAFGGFGSPFNINNNNNVNILAILEELRNRHNVCPPRPVVVRIPPVHSGSSCSGPLGWGDRWP